MVVSITWSETATGGTAMDDPKDWGNIGWYVQLLDVTKVWFEDNCDYEWREDYDDNYYEGAYDYWDCGPNAEVVVIGARPIADPTAYLVLVQVQITSDFDFEVLEQIIDTFDVDEDYLP